MDKLLKSFRLRNLITGILLAVLGVFLLVLYVAIEAASRRYSTGQTAILLFALVIIAGGAYFIFRGFSTSAIEKSLFGGADELNLAAEDVRSPLVEDKFYTIGNTYILANKSKTLKHALVNMDRVAWAYKSVTQHRYNGIPTGKTYKLMVYEEGIPFVKEIVMNEQSVMDLLTHIRNRNEKVIVGYNAAWLKLWHQGMSVDEFYSSVATLASMSN